MLFILYGKDENLMQQNFYTPPYEITPLTLAIVAKKEKKRLTTRILEEEAEYLVDQAPSKVIDYACKYFGSSLKGRQDGTRDICGITHKAPISIDPTSGMYFFPTYSPISPNCSWIAHSHIDQMHKATSRSTEIIFNNGKRIVLEVTYGSMLNQVQRTAQFRYLLGNRINFLQQYQKEQEQNLEPFS